jgi:hypothetical protein
MTSCARAALPLQRQRRTEKDVDAVRGTDVERDEHAGNAGAFCGCKERSTGTPSRTWSSCAGTG